MKTVTEIAKQTGISVRTLHHYDAIGLLKPTRVTEAGYRMYDEQALERLYLILLFREIGFPLKEIKGILDAPDYDRNRVLEQQIELLKKKQKRLGLLIDLTRGVQMLGIKYLNMEGFDMEKMEAYYDQAQLLYSKSEPWKQWQEKVKNRTPEKTDNINSQVMDLFVRLGAMKAEAPDSEAVQGWVKELQEFFTENFYDCTEQILMGLSELYAGGGSMTENIDAAGGKGTGEFAREAIRIYCGE